MQRPPATAITDVEAWNDALALENDGDDYYARSSFLVRFVEQRRLACIHRMTSPAPRARILEVGCGAGHVLRLFPELDLTAVDVSGEMLEKARRNLRDYRVRYMKGELHELGLPDASFDRIICSEVLEHVVDPVGLLEQIRRLLRPGGRAVITFPNDLLVRKLKRVTRLSGLTLLPSFGRISWGADTYHLHVWRVFEMRALLAGYFSIVQEQNVPYSWLPIRRCFQCEPDVR